MGTTSTQNVLGLSFKSPPLVFSFVLPMNLRPHMITKTLNRKRAILDGWIMQARVLQERSAFARLDGLKANALFSKIDCVRLFISHIVGIVCNRGPPIIYHRLKGLPISKKQFLGGGVQNIRTSKNNIIYTTPS